MMKWAGLAFLGLIAVTAWDVPESWQVGRWVGIEPPVVVLDMATDKALESEVLLLMADPGHDCSSPIAHPPGQSAEAAQRSLAPRAVDLRKDQGEQPEANVLQDVSYSVSQKVAIAMLDPQMGCMLHPRTYLLRESPDDVMLHSMGQGI